MQHIEEGRAAGLNITADQYPYEAGSTMLVALLPTWAHAGGIDQVRSRLRDVALLERMQTDMEHGIPGARNMVLKTGYENIMILYTGLDCHLGIAGLRVTEIAGEWHTDPFDVMIRLLRDEDCAIGMDHLHDWRRRIQSILQAPWRAIEAPLCASACATRVQVGIGPKTLQSPVQKSHRGQAPHRRR